MAASAAKGDDAKTRKSVNFTGLRRESKNSVQIGEDVQRGKFRVRKSIAVPSSAVVGMVREDIVEDDETDEDAPYHQIIEEAHDAHGGRDAPKIFHEEWEAQLLIRCGDTFSGCKVVLFCPFFLKPVLSDPDEMDRAFRFVMLAMDDIAMHKKYIFVYCYLGMDWSNPSLASRLRFAYDILPHRYLSNLVAFYILHPTTSFKLTMWTFWPLVSSEFWCKIEYMSSLDEVCTLLHPNDEAKRADLRRRFPLAAHRRDAELLGQPLPVTFGVPLKYMCLHHGMDFLDRTTGKFYPRLPAAVIFLCESLEREGGEEGFAVFDADADDIYRIVDIIDTGKPLERDMPPESIWCVLKLWVDFLPSPLFTFKAIEELERQQVKAGDTEAQRGFLVDLLHNRLSIESAYVVLYLSSFLHTMCHNAMERQNTHLLKSGRMVNQPPAEVDAKKALVIPRSAARVFAPGFLRPRSMKEGMNDLILDSVSLVKTLITCAEEPDLWIGTCSRHEHLVTEDHADDSSDDLEFYPSPGRAVGDKTGELASSLTAVAAASPVGSSSSCRH